MTNEELLREIEMFAAAKVLYACEKILGRLEAGEKVRLEAIAIFEGIEEEFHRRENYLYS
jgi:hypothetical protein